MALVTSRYESLFYVMLIESILGERSRTVARIKRENFHRGVSCIEPLDMADAGAAGAPDKTSAPDKTKGISWEDRQHKDQTSGQKLRTDKKLHSYKESFDSNSAEEKKKLREIISIRRNSTQQEQKGKIPGVEMKQQTSSSSSTKLQSEVKSDPIKSQVSPLKTGGARPVLVRGSSVTLQQALKTSERPPLIRGYSCQPRRTFPTITVSRPYSTIEDDSQLPKIDILEAVSEIHDNFKDNKAMDESMTEEETEDEFHEQIQGDT